MQGELRFLKLLTVVGARPQFIKAAAVSAALQSIASDQAALQIRHLLVHTGQHYDREMSAVFFDELQLATPTHHLGVGSGAHGWQTGEMLKRLEPILLAEEPDLVLVYGDTNSTLAAAIVAAKLNLPIAHVEAGMRSGRRDMPEEINRVVTDHLSSLLFCSTSGAARNLEMEGIKEGVTVIGDVMLDIMLRHLPRTRDVRLLDRLGIAPDGYVLATVHRAENTDDARRLSSIIGALRDLAGTGFDVVVPLHPRTRARLDDIDLAGLQVIDPVPYEEMLSLESHARVILTDSGGIQKEAYWLGIPCVTLRDETEWPETLETGWNVLAGSDRKRIVKAVEAPRPIRDRPAIYGDGASGMKLVRAIEEWHVARDVV